MKKILPLIIFSFLSIYSYSQELLEFTPITLTGPALQAITDITGSGDGSGRLYIVEKRGVIRVVLNGVIANQQFLSIEGLAMDSGERGLLGLAFHPQYPDSNYIYVNYVIEGTMTTRIARFTVPASTPDNADETSIRILMDVPGIQTNHKAGDLAFGPDGYLYITMGDGGGGGDPEDTGQDFTRLLGKILRIDVNSTSPPKNYRIPPTNPYLPYTGTGDTLPEIFMNGVRNPWRMSFDQETGDLWIADVGQNEYEEINMIPAGTGGGRNLGWDCREGNHNYTPSHCTDTVANPLTYPVFEYTHCTLPCHGGFSITGGFVYRGDDYPDMYGVYMSVDYSTNVVFLVEQTGPTTFTSFSHTANGNSGITTFGESDNREIFAGNLNGTLYYVTRGLPDPLPLQWEGLSAQVVSNGNKIQWTLHNFMDVEFFELQRSVKADFVNFTNVVEVLPDIEKVTYTYHDPYYQPEGVYYRVAAHLNDGSIEYSPVARIMPDPLSKPTLTFDFNTNLWRINLPSYWQNGDLKLYDLSGRIVYEARLSDRSHIDLSRPVPPGVYFIMVRGNEGMWSDRIVR